MKKSIRSPNDVMKSVVEFLQSCGDADIEAGIGALYGNGSPEKIAAFETDMETAIHGKGKADDHCPTSC